MEINVSSLLTGRIEFRGKIGAGAFGEVHRGYDRARKCEVAVKLMRSATEADERRIQLRELEILSELDHPGLVRVLDAFLDESQGVFLLTQEIAEGEDPRSFMARADWSGRTEAMVQILRGLEYLHERGYVHRDIKPANMRIAERDGRIAAKLLDFGLAEAMERILPTSRLAGTFPYIAPELAMGRSADERSDLYALGMSLFVAIGGHAPQPSGSDLGSSLRETAARPAPTPDSFPEGTPDGMRAILSRLLEPDPARRFASANDVIRAANAALGTDHTLEPGRFRIPAGAPALLAGRRTELDQIQAAYESFRAGTAPSATLCLMGDGGHGKSALLQGFKRWAELRDETVVDLSFPDDGPAELLARVIQPADEAAVAPFRPYLGLVLPERFGAADALPPLPESPAQESVRLREKLACALEAATRERRIILLVDDIEQHGDLVDFIAYYQNHFVGDSAPPAAGGVGRMFLAVSAHSPDAMPPGLRIDRLVDLRPWAQRDIAALGANLFGVQQLPDTVTRHLLESTGGLPAAVLEELRHLAERLLKGGDPRAQLGRLTSQSLRQLGAPPTSLLEQLRALEPRERTILEWLCAADAPVSHLALAHLEPGLASTLPPTLRRLRQAGWIISDPTGYRPAGSQRRAALLAQLDEGSRRTLLRRLSDYKRGRSAREDLEAGAELMRAGEAIAGFRLVSEVLRRLSRTQPRRALGYLQAHRRELESLPHPESDQLVTIRAESHLAAGEFAQAASLLEEAVAEGGAGGETLSFLLAQAYRYGGRLADARRLVEEGRLADPSEAAWDGLLADICIEQGDYAQALALADRHLAASPPGEISETHLIFLHIQAKAHFYRREVDQATLLFRQAGEEAERLGLAARHALCLNSLATGYLDLGRSDAAIETLEACLSVADRIGDLRTMALARVNLGLARAEKGEFAKALDDDRQAISLLRKISDRAAEGRALSNLAVLLIRQEDFSGAIRYLDEARVAAHGVGMPHLEALILLQRAECLLSRRDLAGALQGCEEAAALARSVGGRAEELWARLRRIEVQMELEPGADFKHDLEACERDGRAHPGPETEAWLLYLKGRARARSNRTEAGRLLRSASDKAAAAPTADPSLGRKILAALRILDRPVSNRREEWPDSGGSPSEPEATLRTDALAILGIARHINVGADTDSILAAILDSAIELTGADRGCVVLQQGGVLEIRASRAAGRETYPLSGDGFSLSVARETIRTARPVHSRDAFEDPRFAESRSIRALSLRSVLSVPLIREGDAIGALYLDARTRPGLFTEYQAEVLGGLGMLAAETIHKAQLLAENVRGRADLARSNWELEHAKSRVESLNVELVQANEKLRTTNATLEDLVAERQRQVEAAEQRIETLLRSEQPKYAYEQLAGSSRAWRAVLAMLDRAVESRLSVVIEGESGTGKELLARAIHFNSARRLKPFIPVNCAALPPDLFESELFGYVKGAFSGADVDKPGLFEAAHEGTLFLDEVGDLPLGLQPKLLRVLQDGLIRRVGATRESPVNVRIVAATHRDLAGLVREHRWREDLYYRLAVFVIHVPPLRERRDDIPVLVDHFLAAIAREEGKPRLRLNPHSLVRLQAYDWPGNVRELEHAVRFACLFAKGREVHVQPRPGSPPGGSDTPGPVKLRDALTSARRRAIESALERSGGNISAAALELGVHRTRLTAWVKSLGLRSRRRRAG